MTRRVNSQVLVATLLTVIAIVCASPVYAAGLNTDVALTPPEGGTIVRTQWRYSEFSNDPTTMGRRVTTSVQPVTVVHGVTQNFSLLGTVPTVYRRVEFGSGATGEDTGIGDITLLGKYRFYQDDKPGVTTRWAAIGGAEVPSYDEPFSSESFDPIIGTVWTHQRRDWWVDWDVLYKFNTAGGLAGDDELRADTALSYRLMGGQSATTGPWAFYAIGEVNARYLTDGSVQVFGSPGVQLIRSDSILEAGVQLPMLQDMGPTRLERDLTVVVSLRLAF